MPLGCLETWTLNNVSLGWLVSIDNKSDQTNPVFKRSISFQSFPFFPALWHLLFFPPPSFFSLLPSRPVCANAGARLQNGSSNCRVSHQIQSATDQGLIHFHTAPSSHLLHTYIHTHEPPRCFIILCKLQTYAYRRGETGLRTIWSD